MNKNKIYPISFAFLALAIYSILFIIPSFSGFWFSFTNWNAYRSDISYVGLDNFRTIFVTDPNYAIYLGNTLVFAVITTALKVVLGLVLALVLNERLKTRNVLRAVFYLPVTLPPLVVGLIFNSIFSPSRGLLNQFLRAIGLSVLERQWLADAAVAMPSLISVEVWRLAGYCMVIFLAGLQTIPRSLYEAAQIDGATYLQRFVHITLPFLKPALTITIILNLVYGLTAFDIIFVLTRGGPGRATSVLNTAVFFEFSYGRYGIATALGVIVFAITLSMGFFALRLLSRTEVETA
jgi:raffinose/stachyose/melibiose transport system permease protein